jgi:hypothetical protein
MVFAARFEGFSNLAQGVGALATSLGIAAGGLWAYLRFRRTPEARTKTSIALEGRWVVLHGDPHGLAEFILRNDGGRSWTAVAESSWIEVTVLRPSDGPQLDGVIDWTFCEYRREQSILEADLELRPGDEWRSTGMFPLPSDATAIQFALKLSVQARRVFYWPEANCVVIPVSKEVAEG